jgi:hypothetical protein
LNDFKGWIRTILENSNQLNKEQAESLMDRIIKQLYYRDCRAFARVSLFYFNIDYYFDFFCSIVFVL